MNASGVSGSRPDVVLLHGWGTNAHVWRELAKLLARRYRVHTPALAWETHTGAHGGNALARMADRLAAGAPERCAVCGWSLGGAVAMTWALRAPGQVTQLAAIATSACFVQRPDWPHALEAWSVQDFARGLAREPSAVLIRYIALQARRDASAARVARHLRQTLSKAIGATDTWTLQRGLSLLLETDLRSVLERIRQPVLVIHGARDAVVPLAAGEYLARALPNARLSIQSGAGHVPFASDPEGVSAELTHFFDER